MYNILYNEYNLSQNSLMMNDHNEILFNSLTFME